VSGNKKGTIVRVSETKAVENISFKDSVSYYHPGFISLLPAIMFTKQGNLPSMEEGFELPVVVNNTEHSFPARLLNYGYSYKLEVDIDGTKVIFEPDEEQNWRALITNEDLAANKKINTDLLKAIASSIEAILK
jgi:hypothetical protein